MPVSRITVSNSITYNYKLYRKSELRKGWDTAKGLNLRGIVGNKPYLSCKAMCEEEALVLTSLLIREIDNSPANFYYDEKRNRLFMRCYSSNKSDRSVKLSFEKINYEFVGRSCLKDILKDLDGQPLFWNDTKNITNNISHVENMPHGSPFMSAYSPLSNRNQSYLCDKSIF
jgi:hypothetical protein